MRPAGVEKRGNLERFQVKWKPVRRPETRQIQGLEPKSDFEEAYLLSAMPRRHAIVGNAFQSA